MAAKSWENKGRASTDHRDSIKNVEIDNSKPYSYSTPNYRRPNANQYHHQQQRPSSPHHRAYQNHNSLLTPSPSKNGPIHVRSASPRCQRDNRSCSTSQTPSLRSNYYHSVGAYQHAKSGTSNGASAGSSLPNYMAATECAKARARSQSTPRQRPSTLERDRGVGSAKKRLSYPASDCYGVGMSYRHNLRSPSFRSLVSVPHFGLEQQSNYSSCCTESFGCEPSPSSTTELRRWLK